MEAQALSFQSVPSLDLIFAILILGLFLAFVMITRLVQSKIKNKYPQLVSNTRSGRGMRCDEAPYYRSVSSKDACRTITRADEMKRNGRDECGEMVE